MPDDIRDKLEELGIPIIEEEIISTVDRDDGTRTQLGAYTINLEGVPQENITAFYQWVTENQSSMDQLHEFLNSNRLYVEREDDNA